MTDFIHHARALNGPRAGRPLDPAEAVTVLREDTLGWVHLSAGHPGTPGWIAENLSYLDPAVHEALTATATRSRAARIGEGLLVILRGVNTNEGRDPEDMVAVRIWADAHRIVTLSRQPVRALGDIARLLEAGQGPDSTGAFLAMLAEQLNDRLDPLVSDLDIETDALETEVVGNTDQSLRKRIVAMRLQVIELHRHAAPQIAALTSLEGMRFDFISESDRLHFAETRQSLTRLVENLAEMRDSLAVLREELSGQISDRLNRHMYILSILSAVFLPLSFLTGLLGINVGGIPGADNPNAFWIACGGMLGVLALQLWILRRVGWV
ncbi:MAG: zinc transporter ZntB [Pseudooceanicola sp.]